MAARAGLPLANGHVAGSTLPRDVLEYQKILQIRDDVFAGTHPRLKLTKQINANNAARNAVSAAAAAAPPVPSFPLPQPPQPSNGLPRRPVPKQTQQTNGITKVLPASKPATSLPPKLQTAVPPAKPALAPASIDPVLLTKSDVLVRAEIRQKRQRLERSLEDQIHQRRVIKQAASDQEQVPDFDVSEVLRKAHEIVKPFKPILPSDDHAASASSDSFDENTFYSSQMNETTSEDADRSPRHPSNGHRSNERKSGQRSPNQNGARAKPPPQPSLVPASHDRPFAASTPLSRIAELEEELRRLKAEKVASNVVDPTPVTGPQRGDDEDLPYSPPDIQMPLSASSARNETGRGHGVDSHEPRPYVPQLRAREYFQRDHHERSPLPDNVRVIRNHITSPLAPQPSRVSPLAVTKVPRTNADYHQGRRDSRQFERRPPGDDAAESGEPRDTWRDRGPTVGSRKRRRGPDSRERARNVHARRDTISPEIRIKEEPASPPPTSRIIEARTSARRPDQRPVYIENDLPAYSDPERVVYLPPRNERDLYLPEQATPVSPMRPRVASHTLFRHHQEPDLRRVVSTRQLRQPSPIDRFESSPGGNRVVPQTILANSGEASRSSRASVQPRVISDYEYNRPISPQVTPSTPLRREADALVMAPPARRVVIDQHGNRYLEAFDQWHPTDLARPTDDPGRRYERSIVPPMERREALRPPSIPPPERAISPAMSRYDYPAPRTMQVLDRATGEIMEEREYVNGDLRPPPVTYAAPPRPDRYEELAGPQDVVRMQSVRPAGTSYGAPFDRSTRVQSLHPEHERYLRPQEVARPISRQASVRPETMVARPTAYSMEERPRYQFPQEIEERRYARGGNRGRYVYMDAREGSR